MAEEDMHPMDTLPVEDLVGPALSCIFPYKYFNAMQTIVANQAFHSTKNMVVAAPTGCGKTCVLDLSIAKQIAEGEAFKCLYIAPNKALCSQRFKEWSRAFESFNFTIIELTGDSDMSQSLQHVAKASIIITTPEKWDSITRTWKRHLFLLGSIDLLLIDEVHHISEDRGAVLEAVVVRMQKLNEILSLKSKGLNNSTKPVRMIALSATLPNVVDIGEWLRCSDDSIHYFDDSFRPVPLTLHTLSYGTASYNTFLFEKNLDSKVFDVIRTYSNNKPSLVFCGSKKSTETLAELLSQRIRLQYTFSPQDVDLIRGIQDAKLRELVYRGVAFHHAGLPPSDKVILEQLYCLRKILILTCTSTLAFGVNLPAHLVIVKGTSHYRGGEGYVRLPRSMVLQMIGRAGRQGLDTNGVAVVMTNDEDKAYFQSNIMDTVESTLPSRLVETICSEICQSVITDLADALLWIKRTFFYVRVRKNQMLYGFEHATNENDLENLLMKTCADAIEKLGNVGIVDYKVEDGCAVSPNIEAHLMSRHMIKFSTMVLVMKIDATANICTLLKELCQAEELIKPVRRSEKKYLNDLMKTVRFPIKNRVQEPCHKAYVLIQSAVSIDSHIPDFTLRIEQGSIVELSLRILKLIREYCIEKSKGCLLEVCIYLKRSLELRVWEVSDYSALCECPGIEENTRKLVAIQGPKSLEDLRTIILPRIQVIARCPIKEAQSLQEFAQNLCANALATSLTVGADDLIIGLRPYFEPFNSNLSPKRELAYDLIASDRSNGNLVLTKCLKCGEGLQEIRVPLNGLKASNIQVKLIAPHTVLDTDLTFSTTASINPVEGSVKAANIRVPSEIEVGSLALPKPLLQSSRAKAVSKNKIMDKTNRDGKQMENFGVYSSDAPRYEDKPRSQPPQKSIPAFSQYSTFQSPDSALQLMRRKAEEAALSTVTVKRLKSSANVSYFVDHEVQDPLQQALSPPPNAAKFFRSAQKPSAPFFFTDAQQLKSEIACPSIEDLVPIKTSTQQTPLYATQLYSQEISEPQQFRQRLPRRDVHSDSYAAEDDVNVAKENLPFPDIRREREERFKKAFAF